MEDDEINDGETEGISELNPITSMAKYQPGTTIWYISLEKPYSCELGIEYNIFTFEHPIFIMSRTPLKHIWNSSRALPKIEGESFDTIISLLTSNISVQSMVVENIERSENTGEFVYYDEVLEVIIPEQIAYIKRKDAQREKTRILRMIIDWATAQLEPKNEMFTLRRTSNKQ